MTHDSRRMAESFLGITPEHVQHMRILASRADPRSATRPPWTWANLTAEETEWLDLALDNFVDAYNDTHAVRLEEVIPPCWRKHPGLLEEMPVQLWAWWAPHLDEVSTPLTVLEYHNRHLPLFQARLQGNLLGRAAASCRKGRHDQQPDRGSLRAVGSPSVDIKAGVPQPALPVRAGLAK